MEAVTRAIRSALEKGDAQDRAFREKVYRQAFAALDRSLQARSDISAEDVRRRREQVKAAIIDIEREFVSAPAPENTHPFAPPPSASRRPSPQAAPAMQEPDFAPRAERRDRLDTADALQPDFMPDNEVRVPLAGRRKRRRPFVMLLVLAVLVAAIGVGLWWTIGGMPQLAEERGAVQNQPPAAGSEQAGGANGAPLRTALGETEASDDWIAIFAPDDPSTVSTPAGVDAEAVTNGNESFLRIGGGDGQAGVAFDVGQGVLESLAGKRAVFSLTARAQDEETQISISCDFGALGNCGRTRYMVGATPAEYLFEVDLPDQEPDAGGSISIVPDIEGQGRMLDVLSLRVTAAN